MIGFLYVTLAAAPVSPYYAYEHSDLVGKSIVIILLVGSILTWTIMIEKGIALRRARKASEDFINFFRNKKYPLGAFKNATENIGPVARVYESGAERLLDFYNIHPDKAEFYGTSAQYPVKKLSAVEIESVRTALEREVSDQIIMLEEKIGMLATAVSASPLLGLFGTVWGIMMAFCSLASQGRADIAGLAPGISGALLTTVVGLVVAIPSLMGYNLLTYTIRTITVYMDNFVEEFMAKIKLEQFETESQGHPAKR